MAKTLCDWSRGKIEKHADKLLELVREPSFFCRKCARVANTPKVLCEPRRFPAAGPAERLDAEGFDQGSKEDAIRKSGVTEREFQLTSSPLSTEPRTIFSERHSLLFLFSLPTSP